MNTILYGNYFQDNNYKEPIEWIPIYKYVIQNEEEPQFLLLSRNILLSFKSISQWEYSDAREYLNNSFFDEAFTNEEKSKLTIFPGKDIIRIPFLSEIYDGMLKKDFYNKEILKTELTAWAANGNAFELRTTYKLSNGMLQMNPAYEWLLRLSLHPAWQILSGSNMFEQIFIKCESNRCYRPNESEFYGMRPCIKVKQSTFPILEKISNNVPVEYIKETHSTSSSFPNTKIKINRTPQELTNNKTYNVDVYGPSPK